MAARLIALVACAVSAVSMVDGRETPSNLRFKQIQSEKEPTSLVKAYAAGHNPPYDPNHPNWRFTVCSFGGFHMVPANAVQMQFCGASVMAEGKGCSWDDWVTCSSRTKEECENPIPGSKTTCWWYKNGQKYEPYFGEGSCVFSCYTSFEVSQGIGYYFDGLLGYSGKFVDTGNIPETTDMFKCLKEGSKGPEACANTFDSKGYRCNSCYSPRNYYKFNGSVPSDRNNLDHWCVNSRGFPGFCDFLREPANECGFWSLGKEIKPADYGQAGYPTVYPTATPEPTEPPTTTEGPTTTEALIIVETIIIDAPVEEETTTTEAPVEEETTTTEAPVEEETTTTEAPVEEKTTTEAPVEEETTTTEAPVEEETTNTEAPVEEETTNTEAPVEEETTTTEAPVEEKTTTTEAPVEEETTTTEAPVEEETTTTEAPVEEERTTTEAPVEEERTTTEAPVEEKTTTEAPVEEAKTTSSDEQTAPTSEEQGEAHTTETEQTSTTTVKLSKPDATVSKQTAKADGTETSNSNSGGKAPMLCMAMIIAVGYVALI